MARRRIAYGVTLAAVLLFQITNDNYLAHFLLALTLALPVLSLLLSLPVLLGCRLALNSQPAAIPRGDEGAWLITLRTPVGLPVPRLVLRLEEENRLTGAVNRKKLRLTGASRGEPVRCAADTSHCGLLELRVKKARVCDYLGLFVLRLPLPEPARMAAVPLPLDPGPVVLPEIPGAAASASGAPRRTSGEDYDLREYRPGDPLRTVHWKLSSKWDDLIVREPTATAAPLPRLTFDRWGAPERLDGVLDRLIGYCRRFLSIQQPHAVQWLDVDGQPVTVCVTDEKALNDCLLDILSTPAPRSAPAGEWEGGGFSIRVTAGEEDSHD